MKSVLLELQFPNQIKIYCDSTAASSMILNPVQRQKAKHFNVQYHWVRENHKTGRLQYYHLEGAKQPADMFTKALPLVTLQRHLREIGFGKVYQYTMYNKYTVNVFTGAGVPSRGC